MFSIGDKIVHPMHGAGQVVDIVSQNVGGEPRDYYVLKIPVGDMTLMVPVATSDAIGVRPVMDANHAKEILGAIPGIKADMTSNWNQRYRENMSRIKSGDLIEVAKVVKGLAFRDRGRGLSTGERKMLHSAKQILISEIVLALNESYEMVEGQLDAALRQGA